MSYAWKYAPGDLFPQHTLDLRLIDDRLVAVSGRGTQDREPAFSWLGVAPRRFRTRARSSP